MKKACDLCRRVFASKYAVFITVSIAVVILDQLTKMAVRSTFDLDQSMPIIHGFFNLTYTHNTGAAWSLFSQAPELFRKLFFLSIPPLAVLIIVFFISRLPNSERFEIFSLSLISGGAIGNYIDRLHFGYVNDFLDCHYRNVYHFPVFNLADSSIVIGVSLLTILMVMKRTRT